MTMFHKFHLLFFFATLAPVAIVQVSADHGSTGSAVQSPEQEKAWWDSISSEQKKKVTNIFDQSWYGRLPEQEAIAFASAAHTFYSFLETGADSNPDDHYQSFAPLLLRTAFHSSGSYDHSSGTGGSNGATILNARELSDDFNLCIENATTAIQNLLHGSATISLADSIVIAGVVALDVMEFPRMDLIQVEGGRVDVRNMAYNDRLASPDNDPMQHFATNYNLTVSELVALIGGGHNFGSAHGMCSGYIGQWTNSPLTWADPSTDAPAFFVDLMREDWKWFEVCTYVNRTASYTSIEDPFAQELPAPEEDVIPPFSAGTEMSSVPIVCEEQAMRGCLFADGLYDVTESPCDVDVLQMRLRSDFFLKSSPVLLPHAKQFAADPDLFAREFGNAYRKLMRNGLDRCGLAGHGCQDGTKCVQQTEEDSRTLLTATCQADYTSSSSLGYGNNDDSWSLNHSASIAVLVLFCLTSLLSIALLFQLRKKSSKERHNVEEKDANPNPEIGIN